MLKRAPLEVADACPCDAPARLGLALLHAVVHARPSQQLRCAAWGPSDLWDCSYAVHDQMGAWLQGCIPREESRSGDLRG
jgi:hypothetical protein